MAYPHLPSTQSAIDAVRTVAAECHLEVEVTHDIGADRTSRRESAGAFAVVDADGSLPHEAWIELGGRPVVNVHLFPDPEADAVITVEGLEFPDVPRDHVPPFLRSVFGGLATVRRKGLFSGSWLTVPLPGDVTYRERVAARALTPWLSGRIRD